MNIPFARLIPNGGLVVSCQAPSDSPFRDPELMALMAIAAKDGGAAASARTVRTMWPPSRRGGPADHRHPQAGRPDRVYITPTVEAALAVVAAGARIVALDGTERSRPDGTTLAEQIARIREAGLHRSWPMSTRQAGLRARDAGADAIATTLSGYTGERPADGSTSS